MCTLGTTPTTSHSTFTLTLRLIHLAVISAVPPSFPYYRHQGHEVAIIQCRSKDDFLQQQPTTAAYLITLLDLSEAVIAEGNNILASTSLQDAPIATAEAVVPIGTGAADPPAVHQDNPSAWQTQVTSSLSRRDEMSQHNPPLTWCPSTITTSHGGSGS